MRNRYRSAVPFPLFLVVILAAGCSSEVDEPDRHLGPDDYSKTEVPLFPFAGRVSIDGHVPRPPGVVVLALKEQSLRANKIEPIAVCDAEGNFAMGTFRTGDGCPAGRYVLVIAKLRAVGRHRYVGPDELHNLYSGTHNNAEDPRFVIDQKAPGTHDYQVDLKVRGLPPAKERKRTH